MIWGLLGQGIGDLDLGLTIVTDVNIVPVESNNVKSSLERDF